MNPSERETAATPARKRDDFDITKVDWPPQDKWDRLYRNVVLAVLIVGIAIGFYFKA